MVDESKVVKRCEDSYGFGCTNSASGEDIPKMFRLLETNTGSYYRRVCKVCEKNKKAKDRARQKRPSSGTGYEGSITFSGGFGGGDE